MSGEPLSEDLHRTVLDMLPHGVCVYGPDLCTRLVNPAYQRIMVGSEVRLGEHYAELVDRRRAAGEYGALAEEVPNRIRVSFSSRTAYEQMRDRPNGTTILVRAVPLPAGGMVIVVTDVTARARAEAEAERRLTTLQAMLDNHPDGIALFDGEGHLIASNALAARLTGLGGAMRPGRHVNELRAAQLEALEFGSADGLAARAAIERSRITMAETGRILRTRPDGTMLDVRTAPTADGGFVRTYRDVTEEHRARAELEAARDAAEAASRTKSGFLATITHELRTPLHAVIGFSEAIMDETRTGRVHDHAAEVLAAGRQLLGLVDGLLEATRVESGGLSVGGALFDPLPVLRAASEAAQRAAGASAITFEDRLPGHLPASRGDAARLRKVLDALLSNAVKFTPEGGRVTILAEPHPAGGTRVTVADTGIGMTPEDIPRAFEAFTQLEGGLSRRFAGTGLGLYLARAFATAMGMELTLDSRPGQGTTARLTMPPAEGIAG